MAMLGNMAQGLSGFGFIFMQRQIAQGNDTDQPLDARDNRQTANLQAKLDATREELNDAREELENERHDDVNVIIDPNGAN